MISISIIHSLKVVLNQNQILNSESRFLFKKLSISIRLSDSLFLLEVIISVPIEKSLSLGVVVGGPQQMYCTNFDRSGSFSELLHQNDEKSLVST